LKTSLKNLLGLASPAAALMFAFVLANLGAAQEQAVDLKLFEGRNDIGKVKIPGSAEYDPAKKELRMTASGENIWSAEDAFYFAWRKTSGDLTMTADISFVGKGKNAHRKAGWMVRQGLEADAANVGVAVHGDGLIILHYRKDKGGPTMEIKSTIKNPATVRLERHGDVFALSVAKAGQDFQQVAALTVKLPDPVHAGLFMCSHEADITETATFTGLSFKNTQASEKKRVQETFLETLDIATGERKVVYHAREIRGAQLVQGWQPVLRQSQRRHLYVTRPGRHHDQTGHPRRRPVQQRPWPVPRREMAGDQS